jgi:hypothetical protein
LARRDIKPEDYLTPEAQELLKYKQPTVEEQMAAINARRPKNTLPEMYDMALREMAARRAEAGKSGGLDDIIKVLAGAKKGYGGMAEAYGGMQEGRKAAIDKLREQEMALQFKKAEAQQAYENGDFERFKKLRDEFQQDTLKLLSAKAKLTQDARETYGKDLTEREKLGETTALRREATAQREQAARQGSAVRLAANQDAAVAKWRSTIEYTDLSAKLLSKDPAVAKAARTAIDTREREEREKARKAFLASEGTLQSGQSGAFEVLRKTPP